MVFLDPGTVVFTPGGQALARRQDGLLVLTHRARCAGENTSNEWLEPVDDAHHERLSGGLAGT